MRKFFKILKSNVIEGGVIAVIIAFIICIVGIVLLVPPYLLGYIIPVDRILIGMVWLAIMVFIAMVIDAKSDDEDVKKAIKDFLSGFGLISGSLVSGMTGLYIGIKLFGENDFSLLFIVLGILLFVGITSLITQTWEDYKKER